MRRFAAAVVSVLVFSAAPAFAGDQTKPEGEEPVAEAVDATVAAAVEAAAAAVDAAAAAAAEAPKPKDKPEEEAATAS